MGDLATYDLGGSGRTFVIVHGYTGSSDDFIDVAAPLTDMRRVVLVDQLGHGASPRRQSYNVSDLAAAVTKVLDEIGEPVDLLGHSMGGRIALPIAIERPDLVRSLVMMDTWGDPPKRSTDVLRTLEMLNLPDDEAVAALAASPPPPATPEDELILAEWGPDWVDAHNETNARRDPLAIVHLGREIFQDRISLLGPAGSIDCPTTIMVGEFDEPFLAPSQRMADSIRDAELVTISGAYHSPQLTHPREWQAAIRHHLERAAD